MKRMIAAFAGKNKDFGLYLLAMRTWLNLLGAVRGDQEGRKPITREGSKTLPDHPAPAHKQHLKGEIS